MKESITHKFLQFSWNFHECVHLLATINISLLKAKGIFFKKYQKFHSHCVLFCKTGPNLNFALHSSSGLCSKIQNSWNKPHRSPACTHGSPHCTSNSTNSFWRMFGFYVQIVSVSKEFHGMKRLVFSWRQKLFVVWFDVVALHNFK